MKSRTSWDFDNLHTLLKETWLNKWLFTADLTEAEKDEIYGRIANRLATIGDHLMVEREAESSARSASTSPRSKPFTDGKISPENGMYTKPFDR